MTETNLDKRNQIRRKYGKIVLGVGVLTCAVIIVSGVVANYVKKTTENNIQSRNKLPIIQEHNSALESLAIVRNNIARTSDLFKVSQEIR